MTTVDPTESWLEGTIATELIDRLTMGDHTFRVGDRKFRMAFLEEAPDEPDECVVLIEPATGDLYSVEVEVFVNKLARVETAPPKPEVDPNQLELPT